MSAEDKCRCDANQYEDGLRPHASWCLANPFQAELDSEPAEADLAIAEHFLAEMDCMSDDDVLQNIAGMLASQRAEIVARYEAVADQLTDAARATDSTLARSVLASSILAIREAAPK